MLFWLRLHKNYLSKDHRGQRRSTEQAGYTIYNRIFVKLIHGILSGCRRKYVSLDTKLLLVTTSVRIKCMDIHPIQIKAKFSLHYIIYILV